MTGSYYYYCITCLAKPSNAQQSPKKNFVEKDQPYYYVVTSF